MLLKEVFVKLFWPLVIQVFSKAAFIVLSTEWLIVMVLLGVEDVVR